MSIQYSSITPSDNPIWDVMESVIIKENHEPLVPVSMSSKIKCYPIYYKMGVGESIPECFVRKTVFEKLLKAAASLPDEINLVVLDGWRPYGVQQYLYETFFNHLKQSPEHEGCDEASLIAMTRNIVSPARTNVDSPSPHLTGGAVDVTLCDTAGRLLDMGTVFDENNPLSWTAALEHCEDVDPKVVNNRRVLYHAMTGAGFTNLPSEWWHYDYGDQMWAYFKKQSIAIYGRTKPLELERLWDKSILF